MYKKNNYNYSFFVPKKALFCSTLSVLWLCTKVTLWLYSEQHLEHPERVAMERRKGEGRWGVGGGGGWRGRGKDPLSVAKKYATVRHAIKCPFSAFLMSLPWLLVSLSHVVVAPQGRGVASPGLCFPDRVDRWVGSGPGGRGGGRVSPLLRSYW